MCFFFFFLKIETVQNRDNNKGRETETGRFLRAKEGVGRGKVFGEEIVEGIARRMSDNSLRRKTRSASICAPGFSSMEQMLEAMPPSGARERDKVDREKDSGSGTPDGSTPTRRRRPATRSQSARVSGANKSIRRRAAAQGNQDRIFLLLLPLFSEMRLRDLFVMEILLDGTSVFFFISFRKERRWRLA